MGYGIAEFAPGHRSNTEPWIAGHNLILSHAKAVELYRTKYKSRQGGQIGITLNCDWQEPYDHSPENVEAAQNSLDVALGWFADPIYLGHYPASLKKMLGGRLPDFTEEEMKLVHGSSDFYGMNTYSTNLVKAGGNDEFHGMARKVFTYPDGSITGPVGDLPWLRDIPWGLRKLLNYIYERYKTPIYMTENGFAVKDEGKLSLHDAVHDEERIRYYHGYLEALKSAVIEDGVDVRSYFGWSFLDNWEWASGLGPRFGVVHTDYETFERTPKESASFLIKWFKENIKG